MHKIMKKLVTFAELKNCSLSTMEFKVHRVHKKKVSFNFAVHSMCTAWLPKTGKQPYIFHLKEKS
jgi:hypothetical protein